MNDLQNRPGRRTTLRPRDASTLMIVRRDKQQPHILMGKRHKGHAFMPNMFVFPGGRLDAADCRIRPYDSLKPHVEEKLLVRMRGGPSRTRAQGLALAAIRETFEETGLILGHSVEEPPSSRNPDWQTFFSTGHAPTLAPLIYFARAITPPVRPRRYDTRFFVVEAEHIVNLDNPLVVDSDELLDIHWLPLSDAKDLELPTITHDMLELLAETLSASGPLDAADRPIPFQYKRGKRWMHETI